MKYILIAIIVVTQALTMISLSIKELRRG